ncbi:SAM-dependent methyltransferase, partial [Mycoplasmopsis pullorum]
MNRNDIINTIGEEFLVSNTEKGEYSYSKRYTGLSKEDLKNLTNGMDKTNMILDMRFSTDKLILLVETKQKINTKKKLEDATSQLQSYLNFEKKINKLNKKIVSMLVSLEDSEIKVYFGDNLKINEEHLLKEEKNLKHITYYEDLYFGTKNNKEEIMKNTYELNELLHKYGIHEAIRSQLVGTCLLTLKQELKYDTEFTTEQIISGIEG